MTLSQLFFGTNRGTGCDRCLSLQVYSLPLHRHSYIGFILAFASSIHNKQLVCVTSSTTNPVCERRVDLLVYSLPLHRHSYIGFILSFDSSIHNKQQFENFILCSPCICLYEWEVNYIVNLLDFYSYRLIGKLTAFLQHQEFSQHNLPVASSTSAARLSLPRSKTKVA